MASVVERKLQHRFAGLGTDAQIVRPYRSRGRVRQYQSLHVMMSIVERQDDACRDARSVRPLSLKSQRCNI